MNTAGLKSIIRNVQDTMQKHSPEILTGLGIGGMITSTILAVRATPKALKLMEAKKKELKTTKLTAKDTVKTTWKCYIPAVATSVVSATCIIGASSVNLKRNAALATAYRLSEAALTEYKEKVIETIGEKKEQAIHDEMAKDKVERNPVSTSEVIITDKGDTLFYDILSGRYFKSDIEKIRAARNELNRQMLDDMYISVNEFYDAIGLPHTAQGYEFGWNITKGYIDLYFSAQMTEDERPCLAIEHRLPPTYDFRKY